MMFFKNKDLLTNNSFYNYLSNTSIEVEDFFFNRFIYNIPNSIQTNTRLWEIFFKKNLILKKEAKYLNSFFFKSFFTFYNL